MNFVQIVEFETDDIDAVNATWQEAGMGDDARPYLRAYQCADRDNPGRYLQIVVFEDHAKAMANSESPETQAAAGKMAELCKGEIKFRNLDLLQADPE